MQNEMCRFAEVIVYQTHCIVMRKVIQHRKRFPKSIPHFLINFSRWFKKLEDGISDAPRKSLQRRLGLEVVDELAEIVC